MPFSALVLSRDDEEIHANIETVEDDRLPDAPVTIDVEYSSLNYKDALVLAGAGNLVKVYPHIPGIDLAGTVVSSTSTDHSPGDGVAVTGHHVGERWWGGYSQRARVRPEWIVKLPSKLDTRTSMALGTAGFTAMLCVDALRETGIAPDDGPVLVTGATGGVGTIAVHLLATLGFEVEAATGSSAEQDLLRDLGASVIVPRDELSTAPSRPLASQRWSGVVDTVGGQTLASVLTQVRYGGAVAACGNAGGMKLDTTVLPFILRGVRLLGVDSVAFPNAERAAVWGRLSELVDRTILERLITTISLEEVPERARQLLDNETRGRTLVALT